MECSRSYAAIAISGLRQTTPPICVKPVVFSGGGERMCVVSTQIDGVLHDIDQNVWVSKWCKWEEENAVDGWGFAYVEYHSLDLLHPCHERSAPARNV